MTSIKMSAGKNVYLSLIRLIVTSTLSDLNVEQNKTLKLSVMSPAPRGQRQAVNQQKISSCC